MLYHPCKVLNDFQRLEIQEQLTERLCVTVDFVVLNKALTILQYQVLKKGLRLMVRNLESLALIVMHVPSMYEDIKIVRRPMEKKFFESIKDD